MTRLAEYEAIVDANQDASQFRLRILETRILGQRVIEFCPLLVGGDQGHVGRASEGAECQPRLVVACLFQDSVDFLFIAAIKLPLRSIFTV